MTPTTYRIIIKDPALGDYGFDRVKSFFYRDGRLEVVFKDNSVTITRVLSPLAEIIIEEEKE